MDFAVVDPLTGTADPAGTVVLDPRPRPIQYAERTKHYYSLLRVHSPLATTLQHYNADMAHRS
eukprot:1028678-Prorocentrum_lima.AAC.1